MAAKAIEAPIAHSAPGVDDPEDGMSMICVTHELGFAREEVAHRIIFMDEGALVEDRDPAGCFEHPDNPRTKKFLSKILR